MGWGLGGWVLGWWYLGECHLEIVWPPPASQFYSNDPTPFPYEKKKAIPGILYCKKLKENAEPSTLPISTKVATDLSLNHSRKTIL